MVFDISKDPEYLYRLSHLSNICFIQADNMWNESTLDTNLHLTMIS